MNQTLERTTHDVEEVVEKWSIAELRGDVRTLGELLIDDFVGIGPLGFMLNKQQWLGRYSGGDLRYDTFALEEMTVRAFDDAAIVTGRQEQAGMARGHAIPGGGRATLVFVRPNGRWQLANWQLSPIAGKPS